MLYYYFLKFLKIVNCHVILKVADEFGNDTKFENVTFYFICLE